MFRSMDAYVLLIGLIAFGSMVSEGTMFDWSGVYFESVVQPGPGLVPNGICSVHEHDGLGRFTADRMVMRFGAVRVLRASGILIAAGLLVAVLFPVLMVRPRWASFWWGWAPLPLSLSATAWPESPKR